MNKQIIFLCFFIFSFLSLFSSSFVHKLENSKNLSNHAILCMHQDQNGFIWFGTYDGLNLYAGNNINIFRFEPDNQFSLLSNIIYKITESPDGYLWISTQLGINKLSLKERKIIESWPEFRKALHIASDSKGNLWIASKPNYLSYYDNTKKDFREILYNKIKTDDSIRELFIDKNDELYLILSDGTLKNIKLLTQTSDTNPTDFIEEKNHKLHNIGIQTAFYENDIIYYIDNSQILFMYDCNTKKRKIIKDISNQIEKFGSISKITNFNNDIYISYSHNGLMKLDSSNHYFPESIYSDIGVFCILKDKHQNALWIGTDGQGPALYFKEKEEFGSINLSNLPFIAKKPIRSIYTDEKGNLWFGTKGDGVVKIKDYAKKAPSLSSATHIKVEDGLSDNKVFSFFRSKSDPDILFMGTEKGISYYSYKKRKTYNIKDPFDNKTQKIHSIHEEKDSSLWLATTGDGLQQVVLDRESHPYKVLKKQSFFFTKDNNRIGEFHSMCSDGDSLLFIGSRGGFGVICFNFHSRKYSFISTNNTNNMAVGDVLTVYRSQDSTLYFGASSGLTKVRAKNRKILSIEQFNRKDGMINDMIHGILEDNYSSLWLSTNKGLVKYNPINNSFYNYRARNLDLIEFSDDAYWHCPITNRLFFGGINGLVWIEPSELASVDYKPNLFFLDLKLIKETTSLYEYNIDPEKTLKLSYANNSFSISFFVLDYINGESYDYSYQLEGYNTDWVSLEKQTHISFFNIAPGEYKLKVKYRNDVVDSNENIYTLKIRVSPPWHLSIYALVSYGFLLFLFIFIILRYIKIRNKKSQELIAEKIEKEQKEKLYETKMNFFTNITHELCTPLTLINGASEYLLNYDGHTSETTKYATILRNNILNLNELVEEIIDFRKIEEFDISKCNINKVFISKILNDQIASFSKVVEENKIKLITSIPEDLHWYSDSMCIKKIISNLISNAFKYTTIQGTIKISAEIKNENLKIIIYNTGKGIEPKQKENLFDRYKILDNMDINAYNQLTSRNGLGLSICYNMVKILGGGIEVKSEVNQYAEFIVNFPKLENLVSKKQETQDSVTAKLGEDFKLPTRDNNILVSKKNVLVVDDNKDIVDFLYSILSDEYNVLKAYSGREALEILKQEKTEVILTDIIMPEIDGINLVNTIRKDKYAKHIPIIGVSAKKGEHAITEAYEAGFDAYIEKPFSSKILLSIVKRFVVNKSELQNYFYSSESSYEHQSGLLMHKEDKIFMDAVIAVVKEHIENENLRTEFIAEKLGMNAKNFYRKFKKSFAMTPTEFIKDHKIKTAAKLLLTTNLSVKEISYRIGISNTSYFHNEFLARYKLSPKEFRRRDKS